MLSFGKTLVALAALMLVLASAVPAATALVPLATQILGDPADLLDEGGALLDGLEHPGLAVPAALGESQGTFRTLTLDPAEWPADDPVQDFTLTIDFDPQVDPFAEGGLVGEPAYDRISLFHNGSLAIDVTSLHVGDDPYSPENPSIFINADCSASNTAILSYHLWILPNPPQYHVCDDGEFVHITIGSASFNYTASVTVGLSIIDWTTEAAVHALPVELMATGRGLDLLLGVPLQDTLRSVGAPGPAGCDILPEEAQEVLSDTACKFVLYGAHGVPYEVLPGAPFEITTDGPDEVVAGEDGFFEFFLLDMYGNVIDSQNTTFSETTAGVHKACSAFDVGLEEECLDVTVIPATPANIVPDGPATLTAGEEGTYGFTLEDDFGNEIDSQATTFSEITAGVYENEVCSTFAAPEVADVCVTVEVVAADPVKILADGPSALIAGEVGTYEFTLEDEFENEIGFQVETFSETTAGVYENEVCSTFEAPEVADVCLTVAVAPAAPAQVEVEGPPAIAAGFDAEYTFTLEDEFGNLHATETKTFSEETVGTYEDAVCSTFGEPGVADVCVSVEVFAADPFEIIADGPETMTAGVEVVFIFSLRDAFGNEITSAAVPFNATNAGPREVCHTFEEGLGEHCEPVEVLPAAPTKIEHQGQTTIPAGVTEEYTFTLEDEFGNVHNTEVKDYTNNFAGFYEAVVCSSFGVEGISERCLDITVQPAAPSHVVFVSGELSLTAGDSTTLTFSLQDEFGSEIESADVLFDVTTAGTHNVCSDFQEPGVAEACEDVSVTSAELESFSITCPETLAAGTETTCVASDGVDAFGNSVDLGGLSWTAADRFGSPISISGGTFTAPTQTFFGPVDVEATSDDGPQETVSVAIVAGDVALIAIRTGADNTGSFAAGARTLDAAETQLFCAAGYDDFNNYAGDQESAWSVSNAELGDLSATTAPCTTFEANKVGTGTLTANFNSGQASYTTGTITVEPGPLAELVFISPDADTTADDAVTFTIEPRDVKGNARTDDVTCDVLVGTGSIIEDTCTFVPDKIGSVTIQASADLGAVTENHVIDVTVGALDHLVFIGAAETTDADTAVPFTVEPRDQNGNVRDDVVTCAITAGPGAIDACTYTPDMVGVATIEASAGSVDPVTHDIEVTPGALFEFILSGPSAVTAGVPFDVTITARDQHTNTKTDHLGTVSVESSDAAAILPGDVAFAAEDDGVVTTSIELRTSPLPDREQSITVKADSITPAILDGIFVNPGALASYTVAPVLLDQQDVPLGSEHQVSVAAEDTFGNRLLDDHTVFWFLAPGATNSQAGSISGSSGTTDAQGEATVTLTVSSGSGDFFRVRAANNPDYDLAGVKETSGRFDAFRFVGSGLNHETIQAAVDAAADGERIIVTPGTYTETVSIDKPLTLEGTDRDSVIIDRSATSARGISVTPPWGSPIPELNLRSLTVVGPGSGASFGIHVFNVETLLIEDITVEGSSRSELDLHGVQNGIVRDSAFHGQGTAGTGFQITDSHNIVVENIQTSGNNWGGMAVFAGGCCADPKGSSNIQVLSGSTFDEGLKFYTQAHGGSTITDLVVEDFHFLVNADLIDPANTPHDWYFQTVEDALLFAGLMPDTRYQPGTGIVIALADGAFHVGDDMSIQVAVDAATAGGLIQVHPGTYTEDVVIATDLTLVSVAGADVTVIAGQSTAFTGALRLTGAVTDVQIEGFTVQGAGQAAVYLNTGASGVTLLDSVLVAAAGKNALLTQGGQADHLFQDNRFEGDASQLVYVNGAASVSDPSVRVDFLGNSFLGENAVGLGNEAADSIIEGNLFDTTSNWAQLELWGAGITVESNNFEGGLVGDGAYLRDGAGHDLDVIFAGNTFPPGAAVDEAENKIS